MAIGFLEVLLLKAKGLQQTDLFARMDPYVLLQYKGQERKTSVLHQRKAFIYGCNGESKQKSGFLVKDFTFLIIGDGIVVGYLQIINKHAKVEHAMEFPKVCDCSSVEGEKDFVFVVKGGIFLRFKVGISSTPPSQEIPADEAEIVMLNRQVMEAPEAAMHARILEGMVGMVLPSP